MMRRGCVVLLAGVAAMAVACSQTVTSGNGHDGGQGADGSANVPGSDGAIDDGLVVTPSEITLDVPQGGPAATQAYVAKRGGVDVSAMATWTVDDTTLGAMTGSTFASNVTHGGTTLVHASYQGLTGFATVHVKLHAMVTTMTCPGCAPFPALGGATPACTGPTRAVSILYPPDGTLVPPNMNVLETQFDQGTGNTLFEIDFENAVTDVRVETTCNVITDVRSAVATNGCAYDLDQSVWDFLATSNAGGDPIVVTVRATDATGACVATSPGRKLSFAGDELHGGIYYWQSVSFGGAQGKTGGIYRYDFGARGALPDPFLSPTANVGTCVGCHFLSRDGQKMTYGADDPDADDEYSDLHASLLDVATKNVMGTGQVPPGFQTFSPDHGLFLASDGRAMNMNAPAFFLFNGNTGAAATPATVSSGSARGTHPDWSPDGTSVVFVQPKSFFAAGQMGALDPKGDDNHFTGGSLFAMPFANSAFGAPVPLLASQGENNYYPAWSPDGQYVIFNRAVATNDPLTDDAFSNINARALLLPAKGGAPIDLPALNDQGALTNSWPRWSPAIQSYKGHKLVWVTFSSTRDYGDRVRNSIQVQGAAQFNCYPSESPENPLGSKTEPLGPGCHQPQIWMAAIDLSVADSGTGDPSYPAFWLPFQDVTSHNHIAQWVTTIVGGPPTPDGGVPPDAGGPCVPPANNTCNVSADCCGGVCINGTCGIP